MRVSHITNTQYNNSSSLKSNLSLQTNLKQNTNFTGATSEASKFVEKMGKPLNDSHYSFMASKIEKYKKLVAIVEDKIADGLAFLLQKPIVENLVKKTVIVADEFDKKSAQKAISTGKEKQVFAKDLLPTHLMVFGSTVLSGFYVCQTLSNKKLDEDKRRTLAINQGIVFTVSTAMAYTFDKMLGKKTKAIQKTYEKINKLGSDDIHVKGISTAKKIMVVDIVYRFLAPVIVTPLANYIGNKVIEKNVAESKLKN